MNKEYVFNIWSPPGSPWSPWTKPVLFAHLETSAAELPPNEITEPGWCPAPQDKVVLVADLPGADGVFLGIELARRGYRPVPLYNAIPLPCVEPALDPVAKGNIAAVNILPITTALRACTLELARLTIPDNAPPVFLLDANRHGDGHKVMPDEFDNRSVCFTTDFPSANFLLANGFERALLVQKNSAEPRADLAHVLRRWQDGGIRLERYRLDMPQPAQPFEVSRPSWFGVMFQRALLAIGLRRATGGGFGGWMHDSSAGG